MEIKTRFAIGLIAFFVCIVLVILLLTDFLDFEYDWVVFIVVISYSILFAIFLITKYEDFPVSVSELIYYLPKEAVISTIDARLNSVKGGLKFFGLSTIITAFTFYVIQITTIDVVIALIPGTEWVPDPTIPCYSIGEVMESTHELLKFTLLIIGPSWVFLLTRIRDYEIRNLIPKFRGTRVLVIYLWLVVVLFLADTQLDIGCEPDLEPGIYLPPPGPNYIMYVSFYFAFVYGSLVTLFIYAVATFFLPKILDHK